MSSKDNNPLSETFLCVNDAPNALLMVLSIFGNALVLAAILRTPSPRSPSTVFLSSLAVSDLLVGLIVQPVFIATVHKFEHSSFLQLTNTVMTMCVCGVSLSTMTAISVDRFLAVHYHMRCPNFMTTKSATHISTALWFSGIAFSCVRLFSRNAFFVIGVVGIALCLLTSSISYLRVFLIVRRHKLQIQVQQQAVGNLYTEENLNMIRSRKSSITTFLYYICMIICYSPALIFFSIISASPDRFASLIVWVTLSSTVAYLNSAINPFFYCWRLGDLREAVWKILRELIVKQTEGN